jgi:DNA topoisomerase IB
MGRLRRVDCGAPGITRRRRGRGFEYLDESGERIEDVDVLDRIRTLAIPPAWEDVWICADPLGHIQATGVDARGRKQYRYHDRWRERRDREKFEAMVEFARSLPALRAHEYIQETIGEQHSAKDFRTWNSTVLAAVVLAASARERDLATKGGRARPSGTR